MWPIQTTVGLEIVDSDLRISVLKTSFGKFRIIQSHELPEFIKRSDEDKKTALANLIQKLGLQRSRAFLTVPHNLGIIRQIELPVEIGDRLQSAIALQIESLSPWSLDEVYWDYAAEKPGKRAKTLRAAIAIIPRSKLDSWIAFFKSTNLPLTGVALSSLAHAHAAATLWKSPGVVIVNCERSYVEGTILRDGAIAAVSTDIAGIPNWQDQGKDIVAKLLSSSRLKPAEDARLIVLGSNAAALDIQDLPSLPIENAGRVGVFFGAIAAALLGSRESGFNVNLIPVEERYKQSHLQAIPTYALVAVLLLLGLATATRASYQWYRYATELASEAQELAPQVKAVSAQEAELAQITAGYVALKDRLEARDFNLEALLEIARVLPSDSWLSTYSYQDESVTLSGYSQSASEIQRIMEESQLFKDVQFTSAVTRDNSGKDRFNIKAAIEVTK